MRGRGKRLKRDNRYAAYLLLSILLFMFYFTIFNGRSTLLGTVLPGSAKEGATAATGGFTAPESGAGLTEPRQEEFFPGFPVDLNTATADELTVLPGIGPATARRIIEARERAGGFNSVDDLLRVKWIGRVKLETLRPLVAVTATGVPGKE